MSERIKSTKRREKTAALISTPRKSTLTRNAILAAAFRFLQKRPFRDLTIGTLMAQAGASRPTFYQYFFDLHEVMEVLLADLQGDILDATSPWFAEAGDPVELLQTSLTGLVRIGAERGAILRAISDAAASDEKLETVWEAFLKDFDDAVTHRIEEQQALGLIPPFEARPIAHALNRMDAGVMIEKFGRTPTASEDEVLFALTHCWVSILYTSSLPNLAASSGSIENTDQI
jgi:AcrR family transcriptional regulator